jgi:hypothetical protein
MFPSLFLLLLVVGLLEGDEIVRVSWSHAVSF